MIPSIQSRFRPEARRNGFVAALPRDARTLEIGPFHNPTLTGPQVRYFDVLDSDALRARAMALGGGASGVPEIDFVSATGDLSVIGEDRFDLVFSAHCLEHQPDMIRHLCQVGDLLVPGGRYALILPDKRFCFDHFFAVSHIGEVIEAHRAGRRVHSLTSVVEAEALATHNRKKWHWLGLHGRPGWRDGRGPRVRAALEKFDASGGGYIDVHAWQFVPGSFLDLMSGLHEMGLSPLRPVRVWNTPFLRREFTAILQKD